MQVREIITACQQLTQETYDNALWISFINAALDDLTPVARVLKSKEGILVTPQGGKAQIALASDPDLAKAHEVLAVFYTPQGGVQEQLSRLPWTDNLRKGWKRDADSIVIQGVSGGSGTVRVDYYKKLDHVSGLAEVPEIPEQYHNLIVLYACARSQQMEEELNDKNDFYAEYLRAKQAFALDRLWEMEPSSRRLIRSARLAALVGGR